MGRLVRAASAVLALGIGGGVAYLTRDRAPIRTGARPAAVERVVKALDQTSPTSRDDLATALATAGAASTFASPWREEMELAALVLADDRTGLESFASAGPPSPARARARLRLALDARGSAQRAAALDALREAYPDSAAARVYGARTSAPSK